MGAIPRSDADERIAQLTGALAASEAARNAAELELLRAQQMQRSGKGGKGSGKRGADVAQTGAQPSARVENSAATGPNAMRMGDVSLRRLFYSGYVCIACNKPAFPEVTWCQQCRRQYRYIVYVGPGYFRPWQIPTRAGGAWGGDGDWEDWARAWGYGDDETAGGDDGYGSAAGTGAQSSDWGSGSGGGGWSGWHSRW